MEQEMCSLNTEQNLIRSKDTEERWHDVNIIGFNDYKKVLDKFKAGGVVGKQRS